LPIVQIVTNLLSNALKFSPTGGEVLVSIETRGDNVRASVRDHGGGIPNDFKPRIFEKFTQATNGHEQQKGGTGLGLSIVRQIVMRMRGQIGFEDAPGGGTIFYVDLPAADRMAGRQAEFTAEADPAPLAPDDEGEPPMARERTAGAAS
jgi:signal transduction histidine kinase